MTRSAARGTSSATRASAPTPTCTRSATRSGRGTARRRSPTAPSILQYIKDTAAEAGIDEHIRFNHRIVARRLVDRRRPLARHRRAHRHRRDGRAHRAASSSRAAATTATTTATCPTSPGMDRFAGTIVHPQAWPEDLDYAGKRVVVIGSGATAVTLIPSLADDGRARHDAPALADLHRLAARPRTRSPTLLRRDPARAAGRAAPSAGARRSRTQGFYQLSQRRPELVKRMLRKGVERQLPEGYDIDTHFTPRYDPWDQRLCLVPDGDLFKAITAGHGVGRHRPRSTRSPRRASLLAVGRASSRPTSSSPPPGSSCSSSAASSCRVDGEPVDLAEQAHLQGDDARGRAEPRPRRRLHERLVDAEVRPHVRLRHAGCSTTCATTGLRQCTPREPRRRRSPPQPLLGLSSGYVQRAADRFPKQGSTFPWQVHQSYLRDYRALKRRRHRRRRDGVLQPRPRRGRRWPRPPPRRHPDEGLRRAGRRHHRRRIRHRPGARPRAGRPRRAPRAVRHRRGRPGRDRRAAARAPA